ncbi:hypothetical protein D3C87_1572920 [compost metagenome]
MFQHVAEPDHTILLLCCHVCVKQREHIALLDSAGVLRVHLLYSSTAIVNAADLPSSFIEELQHETFTATDIKQAPRLFITQEYASLPCSLCNA